jgi:ATP-binding cassette subfamily A (ABC1) protein 3
MEDLKGNESQETLKITNLVKTFGKKVAVNNLTLTLFKDQILVLLGHNGAGKTTTISILTRDLKPTSGSATAFGIDLFSEGDLVDLVQFCP